MTASAKTGRHVQRCSSRCCRSPSASSTASRRPELNRFLGDVVATRPPPQKQGHRLKLLYIAQIGEAPAALLDPGQQPRQGHPRLRVLPREPAARALRARGHPGDHRLRRAQAAPPRGVIAAAAERTAPFGSRRSAAVVAALALARRARLRGAAARTARRTRAARLVPGRRARLRAPLHRPRSRAPTRSSPALAGALPLVARLRDQLAAAIAPQGFAFERDVRPWLGDELAYAAVSPADSVVLAAVADRPRAEALVARDRQPVRRRALPRRARARGRARPRSRSSATSWRSGPRPPCARRSTASEGEGARARRRCDAYRARARRRARRTGRSSPTPRPPACATCSPRAPGCSARSARCSTGPGLHRRRGDRWPWRRTACAPACGWPAGAPDDAAFEPVLLERVPERAAAYLGVRGALRLARLLERLGAGGALERGAGG